jgi:hypothetical protein
LPALFSRPITPKVLKCKKSAKNTYSTENFGESKSWVKYHLKRQFMPVFSLRRGQSPKKGYKMCIPSLKAATFLPTPRWGVGWQWGVRIKPLNREKVSSQQKCGRFFAD